MRHHTLAVIVGAVSLCACTGNVELIPLDPSAVKSVTPVAPNDIDLSKDQGLPGLIVYLGSTVVEHDRYTQVQDIVMPKGANTPTTINSSDCDRTDPKANFYKTVQMADRSQPYLLVYKHGLLESYTLNVTLGADGTLTGVNATATPDQGKTFSNIATPISAPFKASVAGIDIGHQNQPACNVTPEFYGYEYPSNPIGTYVPQK